MHVLYGSADGLTAKGNQFWSEQSPGIAGKPRTDDLFGIDLAAANFGKDGATHRYDDLAIGVPGGGMGGGGGVHLLYGSAAGLSARKGQVWNQDSPGVPGRAEDGDWFGRCLAAADFGGRPVRGPLPSAFRTSLSDLTRSSTEPSAYCPGRRTAKPETAVRSGRT